MINLVKKFINSSWYFTRSILPKIGKFNSKEQIRFTNFPETEEYLTEYEVDKALRKSRLQKLNYIKTRPWAREFGIV